MEGVRTENERLRAVVRTLEGERVTESRRKKTERLLEKESG